MTDINITHIVAVRTPTGSNDYKHNRDTHVDAVNAAITGETGRVVCVNGPTHFPNGPTSRTGEWITYLHVSE